MDDSISPTDMPRLSIVMPSFNQADFLETALLSILDQGYPNLEMIVIDGGSSDRSVEILESLSDRIAFWVSEPDEGQSQALNKGFKKVTGDLVGWLNSDDTYQPGTLAEVARVFSDPDIQVAMSSEFGFIDDSGEIYARKPNQFKDYNTLVRYWTTNGMTINQPCVFFRRALIAGYDPVLDNSLHFAMDYDLWLRMARDHHIHVIDGHWANYRFHDSSKSGLGFDDFHAEWLAVSKRHWGSPGSLRWWIISTQRLLHRLARRSAEWWSTRGAHQA